MPPRTRIVPCRGFTLVELLAVIAITGLLGGLLIVVLPRVRENANRATCTGNLRQLGLLTLGYAADHKNQLPRSREGGFFSFAGNLLPDARLGSQANHPLGRLLYCPSDDSGGVATYAITAGYAGDNTGLYLRSSDPSVDYVQGRLPLNAYPRPGATFLLVEAPSALRTYPLRGDNSIMTPRQQFELGGTSLHGRIGSHYLYLDGHVAWLKTPLILGQAWPSAKTETYDAWALGYQAQ